MPIVFDSDAGTITGLSVGGLPDGIVDVGTLASGINKTSISDSGDATAITINSSEQVGIGTTPSNALHVHSGGTALNTWFQSTHADTCQIQLSTATNNSYARITNVAGALKYESDVTGDNADSGHQFVVDGSMKGRIDGDGLKFGTDTAAANGLDDYEEGSWTPTFDGNSITNQGQYRKIGKIVYVFCTISNQASSATFDTITGLPFSGSGYLRHGRDMGSSIDMNDHTFWVSTNTIAILRNSDSAGISMTIPTSTTRVDISGMYTVA